jgi:hypothetical protein
VEQCDDFDETVICLEVGQSKSQQLISASDFYFLSHFTYSWKNKFVKLQLDWLWS